MYRKFFAIIIAALSIAGYGYLAFAALVPGQTLDPIGDSLCTDVNDVNCFITFGWTADTGSSYVYNTTDSIGVGTNTPLARVHVAGTNASDATTGFLVEDNAGTDLFVLKNSGTFAFVNSYTGLATNVNKAMGSFASTLVPDVSVNNAEYYGVRSFITFDPSSSGNDLTYSGSAALDEANSNITSGFFRTAISGTGDVAKASSIVSTLIVSGSGSYGTLYGNQSVVSYLSSSTTNDVRSYHAILAPLSGMVTTARGFSSVVNGDVLNTGTDHIDTARGFTMDIRHANFISGIDITARDAVSNAQGIMFQTDLSNSPDTPSVHSSAGGAFGLRIDSNSSVIPAIYAPGGLAYGFYMSPGSISGSSGEYGLYLADSEAENLFVNGLRIGADTNDNKISNVTNGAGSGTLYIGTNTIDTTAPSDERTKTNIIDTSFGLPVLKQLRVVDFMYNQSIVRDDSQQHTGVLAQQVQPIYPEAVETRSDGYLMVDYKAFIPLLIKSVQDLDLKLNSIQGFSHTVVSGTTLEAIQSWFADAANTISLFVADVVKARSQLCIDDVCINKDQMRTLLENNGLVPQQPPSYSGSNGSDDAGQVHVPEEDDSVQEEEVSEPETGGEETVPQEPVQDAADTGNNTPAGDAPVSD